MRTIVDRPGTLFLGKQGENMALELAFREPALWREAFGAGAAQLLCRPPGTAGSCGPAYPVVLEEDGDLAVWRVTAADTARPGYGRCELRWSVEGLVVKSKTYVTYVAEGLSGGCGCGTDNWGAYLERIAQAGAQALEAASRAENAALHGPVIRDGAWWCWDADEGGYADTGVPATGECSGGSGGVEIATDEEVGEMLDEVFGAPEESPEQTATDEEISEMLDEVFGPASK